MQPPGPPSWRYNPTLRKVGLASPWIRLSMIRLAAAFILSLTGCGGGQSPVSQSAPPEPPRRVHVVDADTIDIDGIRYRLHGIDAPESYQTCRAWGHTWDCGKAATQALQSRAHGISCTGESTDHYGRVIGRCSSGGQDVNAWLVLNGWALAEYATDYADQEIQAKAARRGIHRGQYVHPSARRRGQRLEGEDTLAWVATGPVKVPELANRLLRGDTAPIDGELMQHSVFGLTDTAGAVSFGDWRSTNPTESVTWTGDMIARNAAGTRTTGSAHLAIEDLAQPDVDLLLSSLDAGIFRWLDVPLHQGFFQADDGSMEGRFYGPRQDEAGGVFSRHGWTGAFGLASDKASTP